MTEPCPLFDATAGEHGPHLLDILARPVPSAADICEQHPRQEATDGDE